MEFFGNDNDPLAKTLKDLSIKSSESAMGDAGNFFDPVHERDHHVKGPQNAEEETLEFNAALLTIDDPSVMIEYITLRNKITMEECYIIEETTNIDKTSGDTTVFIKWFQPKGSFELGTAKMNPAYAAKKAKALAEANAKKTGNASEYDSSDKKDKKEKGSRKFNQRIKL